jgi:segregation and condensation protein B
MSIAPPEERNQRLRLLEAMLFASADPLDEAALAKHLGEAPDLPDLLAELQHLYQHRGVNLVSAEGRWVFRTAPDLAQYLRIDVEVQTKLSRAGIETLAIIAYHQPVTRAEIESIRGVATSKGTVDLLLEAGWIKPGKRRETPGRPLTWLTTPAFLDHFGLSSLRDLPGMDDLRAAGLLDARPAIDIVPGGSEEGSPGQEAPDPDAQVDAEVAAERDAAIVADGDAVEVVDVPPADAGEPVASADGEIDAPDALPDIESSDAIEEDDGEESVAVDLEVVAVEDDAETDGDEAAEDEEEESDGKAAGHGG